MPPLDALEHLRRAALAGVSAPPPSVTLRRVRRRLSPVPEIPPGATREAREALSIPLRDEAARWWRRATHAWVPPLFAVAARGVQGVEVRERDVVVTVRNAVLRARALPAPWVPVVVAALTGRELPAVRRAMAGGVSAFVPEAPCPTP